MGGIYRQLSNRLDHTDKTGIGSQENPLKTGVSWQVFAASGVGWPVNVARPLQSAILAVCASPPAVSPIVQLTVLCTR